MQYISNYLSPIGNIHISCDEIGLTGLWFDGQKRTGLYAGVQEKDTPVIIQTKEWLDIYFSGDEPIFTPALHIQGTDFQNEVWKMLLSIPYGQTVTYGDIAATIAHNRGISKMSAQAVGGAVGRNRVAIIIPCHRVIGANGSLIGYAGGIDKKIALLKTEKII